MAERDVITTVSEQVEGREITSVENVVYGGGASPGAALMIMQKRASEKGADAVVGVRLIAYSEGTSPSPSVLAYGTAVKLA